MKVVSVDTSLLNRGLDLYHSRPDKDWGLTDCIFFVVSHLSLYEYRLHTPHFQVVLIEILSVKQIVSVLVLLSTGKHSLPHPAEETKDQSHYLTSHRDRSILVDHC